MTVSEGALAVEVDGVEHILRPGDSEFVLRRGVNHRLYPPRNEACGKLRCILSAEKTPSAFALDLVFFENWYAYQEQVVVHGAKLDLIQVMSVRSLSSSMHVCIGSRLIPNLSRPRCLTLVILT